MSRITVDRHFVPKSYVKLADDWQFMADSSWYNNFKTISGDTINLFEESEHREGVKSMVIKLDLITHKT